MIVAPSARAWRALLLGGCTVGPDFHPPVADLPARWQGSVAAPTQPDAPWWRSFGDPLLDRLEDQARAANLDLRIAEERLVAARIARDAKHADSLPQVGAQLGYSRNRIGTAGLAGVLAPLLGQSPNAADATIPKGYAFDLYQTDISASWAIDLWGKTGARWRPPPPGPRKRTPPPGVRGCRSRQRSRRPIGNGAGWWRSAGLRSASRRWANGCSPSPPHFRRGASPPASTSARRIGSGGRDRMRC